MTIKMARRRNSENTASDSASARANKAVIYARVSSREQRKRNTIESQLRELPTWAERLEFAVADVFVDNGISGKALLDQRHGLMRMFDRLKTGDVTHVLVFDLDRFSRDVDLETRGRIFGAFQVSDVVIAEFTTGALYDLRTFEGRLTVQIRAELAADWLDKHIQRTRIGQATALARGRKPNGRTPYGLNYDSEAGVFSVHPEAAAIVREIFARVAAGESCQRIARDLNERGVPCDSGACWGKLKVWRIARAPYVTGAWARGEGVLVVPRLIDDSLWQAAQRKLSRGGRSSYVSQRVYLAQGIGRCGLCDGTIRILACSPSSRRYHQYYACTNRIYPRVAAERCTLPHQRVDDVDARLWQSVVDFFDGQWPTYRERLKHAACEALEDNREAHAELVAARAELARLDGVQETVLGLYRRGLVTAAALEHELAGIERDRTMTQMRLARLERAIGHAGLDLVALDQVVAAVRSRLPNAPLELRRQIVLELIPGTGPYHVRFGAQGELTAQIVVPSSAEMAAPVGVSLGV
jgi:DNA invertase Pin-like site-specific DNA recombinase